MISDATLDHKLTKVLRLAYGSTCQICGRVRTDCGTMHILTKASHPELRHELDNVIWAGWECCHSKFDFGVPGSSTRVLKRIQELRGEDFKERLQQRAREIGHKPDRDHINHDLDNLLEME